MTLSGKDLNLLVALRALLEEANVTRAGERIDVGQSSMSTALSRLRLQFGDELLVRVGRDYELTPMARLILPQLQLTLPLIENALMSHEAFDPATSKRVFRIMMTDYSALQLKPLLAKALSLAPGISFEILAPPQIPTEADRDMMANDFVVIVPGVGVEGEKHQLFVDQYVCIIDRNNPALEDGKLSWEAFKALPHVVVNFGQAHLTPPDRRLSELDYKRVASVKTTSNIAMASVIAGTNLVGVVPSRLIKQIPSSLDVVAVETPFGKVELYQTLWWHSSHNTDDGHRWLKEVLTSEEI